jgi:gliding motility-associated lipoprotein GldH
MFNVRKVGLAAIVLLITIVTTSCGGEDAVFEENKEIAGGEWAVDNHVSFEFTIADTLTNHDFFVNVRNSGDYEYSNLYLFVKTTFPNGKSARDTVECILADNTGRWLGSGVGDIIDHQVMYKFKRRFPLTGNYSIDLQHAMREDPLEGILDVGIRIAKTKK